MLKLISGLIVILGMSSAAWASCDDIRKSCHDNYVLDMASCQNNYTGSGQDDCINRATKQYDYCVKNGGC